MAELETDVVLLKKEVKDMKLIHTRLDTAIVKITDVSNSIHRMLAVHEEKINSQEEAVFAAEDLIEQRRTEFSHEIKELHSRITTNTKELLAEGTRQHKEHSEAIQKLHNDINKRVGVLEKWRHVLIGGSIVIGFVLHKMMDFS
jgi:hypothetical protein